MIIATSAFTACLAVFAPTVTIVQCLAQAERIRRTGAAGVSLGTWLLASFVGQVWLCYGFVFHVPAEVYANIPCTIVASAVAYLAAKSQGAMSRSVTHYLGLTIITVIATTLGTFHQYRWIMASIAVCSSLVIYLPQLALVIRPRDLSGVSAISWFLGCITALSWLIYGFLIHQPAVALPSFVMLPSATVILVQVLRHRIKNDTLRGLEVPVIE